MFEIAAEQKIFVERENLKLYFYKYYGDTHQ